MNETEKNLGDDKPAVEEDVADGNKESPANEAEEKEPEDKVIIQPIGFVYVNPELLLHLKMSKFS